jgi:hypothetical protein
VEIMQAAQVDGAGAPDLHQDPVATHGPALVTTACWRSSPHGTNICSR